MTQVNSFLCTFFLLCFAFASDLTQPPTFSKKCFELLKKLKDSGAIRCEIRVFFDEAGQKRVGLLGLAEQADSVNEATLSINKQPQKFGIYYEVVEELKVDFDHIKAKTIGETEGYENYTTYKNSGLGIVYYAAVISDKGIAGLVILGFVVNYPSPEKDAALREFLKGESAEIVKTQLDIFPTAIALPLASEFQIDFAEIWSSKEMGYEQKIPILLFELSKKTPIFGFTLLFCAIIFYSLRKIGNLYPEKLLLVFTTLFIPNKSAEPKKKSKIETLSNEEIEDIKNAIKNQQPMPIKFKEEP